MKNDSSILIIKSDISSEKITPSKGNQRKWQVGENWVKADMLGYEGLSEYLVSNL